MHDPIKSVLVALALLCLPAALFAERLNVNEGTMALAGSVGINYASADIRETGSISLNFDLLYSYFVIDGLAPSIGLTAKTNVAGNANALQPTIAHRYGATIGLGYYLDLKSIVFPYASLRGSLEYSKETFALGPVSELRAGASPRLGVLIGLNRNVALDFGVAVDLSFPLVESTRATVHVVSQIGYIGVMGFF